MNFQKAKVSNHTIVNSFLVLWTLINLVQAGCTELTHDEAYYWMFSQNLAWGYFDHPPLIALWIKIGYTFFQSELGVRLLTVLAGSGTLYFLWLLLPEKKDAWLFCLLVSAMIITHAGGFITVPDIPLMFFTVVYLYLFKRYIEADTWVWIILTGIVIAILAYAKYHSLLVVLSTCLAVPLLWKRKTFYVLPVIIIPMLIPLFYWQYTHDWVTLKFQLLGRSTSEYHYDLVLNYLIGQIAVFGPIVSIVLFYCAWKYKADNDFEKALKGLLYGFLLFFFLMSFRGRVEPNWTAPIFVPLIYFAMTGLGRSQKLRRVTMVLCYISIPLLFIVRMHFAIPVLPKELVKRNETHGYKAWAIAVQKQAEGLPVIFKNSYQRPSKYMFYTGEDSHSMNTFRYKGNQYDLMHAHIQKYQDEEVFFYDPFDYYDRDSFNIGEDETAFFTKVDSFYSYNGLRLVIDDDDQMSCSKGASITLSGKIVNPTSFAYRLSAKTKLGCHIFKYWDVINEQFSDLSTMGISKKEQLFKPGEERYFQCACKCPEKTDSYLIRFSISKDNFHFLNSDYYDLIVE